MILAIAWSVVACAAGVLLLWGAGWLVARLLLRLDDRGLLFLFAPICGAALASVWLNGVGRAAGWTAAAATFSILGVYGLFRMYRARELPAVRREDRRFMRMGAGIFAACVAINLLGVLYDEHWHFPLVGLVANGNWPVQYPFNPSLTLSYHYGFDLLVAFIAWLGAYVPLASDVLTALFQAALILLAVRFAQSTGLTGWRPWLASALFAFAAGASWILRPFRSALPAELAAVQPFHGSLANALLLVAQTKSLLIAAVLLAGTLVLSRLREGWHHGWRGAAAVVLFLAAAALSSETIVVAFVPALALCYLLARKGLHRGWRVAVLAVAVFVMAVQGGLLTDMAASVVGLGTASQGESTALSVFFSAEHQTFSTDPIHLGTVVGIIRLLAELGGFFILLGFAVSQWRAWRPLERALLGSALVTLLLPLFVHYDVMDQETLRFLTGSFLVTNFLGAVALVATLKRPLVLALIASACVLGGAGDWLLSNVPVTWRAEWYARPTSRALWKPYLRKATTLPAGSVVWTDVPPVDGPRDVRLNDIPIVFGVYAQSCLGIANRVVSDTCGAFLNAPSPETLSALGVSHVLLSDGFMARHGDDAWFRDLVLIARYPDDIPEGVGLFWQGKPGNLALYAVRHAP